MRESEKKLKKFRKKRIWPSIVFFILSLMTGVMMVMVSMVFFLSYIVESKYQKCEKEQENLLQLLNRRLEAGSTYDSLFDGIDTDVSELPEAFCIVGKKNRLLLSYGEQTADLSKKGWFGICETDTDIFYVDTVTESQILDENGDIKGSVFKVFFQILIDEDADDFDIFSEKVVDRVDFWSKSGKLSDGNRLISKCHIELQEKDLLMVGISAMGVLLLLGVLITLQFINTLVNILGQRRMAKLIFLDPVTGGNNWLYFENQAYKLLRKRRNQAKTYVMVDLMLMKYRNYCTLHGAKEGEALLERMYHYIGLCLKRHELCARYGKSDFVLLLEVEDVTDTQTAEAKVTERMNQLIQGIQNSIIHMHGTQAQVHLEERECQSILFHSGVYLVEPKKLAGQNVLLLEQQNGAAGGSKKRGIDISQLYNCAAMARSVIPDNEGNRVQCFTQQMWETQVWENKVEDMMQEALEREEFQVYLQPKYNPVTEELAGAEALVRWISPTEGFISPGKFIPIFEKTGFVTKLDDYMISHVAKLQAGWIAAGKKVVPVSVNVSRAHFAQPDLAEHIKELVDEYQVPHEYVEIELTESAFFDDKNALLHTVKQLQEYGFDVSMDDFGSGYSSLNSLKDLPLDVLKLDAEFFRGEDSEQRGEIVIAEAIALAKQLNMRIVAEGVEKKEQVDFLAEQECDMIQGFYFAKPMPAEEYELRMDSTAEGNMKNQGAAEAEMENSDTMEVDAEN